jgi:flavin-dependent dehydrogenase
VVIGASMAGLLAARALSSHFERVTVLERDPLPEGGEPRRGVPQARHVHVLLRGGLRVLEDLFPGIGGEIGGCGQLADMSADLWWYHFGVWKLRFPSGIASFFCDRPAFERAIRRRVEALGNVAFQAGTPAEGLAIDGDGRVDGVRTAGGTVGADLVVDASGRGSRAPRWLEELGYPRPQVTEVGVDVGYVSRVFRIPEGYAHPWKVIAIFPKPPGTRRLGIMYPLDTGRMLVTLGGWCGDYPAPEEEACREFAATLPVPDVHRFLEIAEPLTPIHLHRFPSNRRLRYERMPRWPAGLAVVGDAACSFNPIYGQGMSVGALQAAALDEALGRLRRRGRDLAGAPGFARSFQRRVAGLATVPWLLATGEDFRYPETSGERPPGIRLLNGYFARVLELSAESPPVHRRFLGVMNFLSSPLVMFSPGVALRALRPAGHRLTPRTPERSVHL